MVYGGGKEGAYLVNHPIVANIHLTGSAATYDAIVWGPGAKKVCLFGLLAVSLQPACWALA